MDDGDTNVAGAVYTVTKGSIKGTWGARGVMVIVIENGHGNTSSNPGPS